MPNPNQANSNRPWTILRLLEWTTGYFRSRQVESPRASAEILLAHTLVLKRIDLYLRYDQPLAETELVAYKALIKRRAQREPVAYIVGNKEFWSMGLAVSPAVLIPRPETECLVERALDFLNNAHGQKTARILELGTGSGAISLALAAERPDDRLYACDYSLAALAVARQNARHHNLAQSVRFFAADWFDPMKPVAAPFDLIISNPPYIPTEQIEKLQPEILQYEPKSALNGGVDGLDAVRNIVSEAAMRLSPQGALMLEIGYDQKEALVAIAAMYPAYESPRFYTDYAGLDRVAQLYKKATNRA